MILDIGLPELNGLEVTRRVRSVMPVAVLIVTVHDSEEVVQGALDAGASGYMLKAEAGRTLIEAVRSILGDGRFISKRLRAAADLGPPDGQAQSIRGNVSRPHLARARGHPAAGGGSAKKRSGGARHHGNGGNAPGASWPSWSSIRCPNWCAMPSVIALSNPESVRFVPADLQKSLSKSHANVTPR
jgi:hypothetical protein